MVKVYTKSNCPQCTATKRALNRYSIEYTEIDMENDLEALSYVKGLGFQAAPVVITADDSWSGYKPENIKALANG